MAKTPVAVAFYPALIGAVLLAIRKSQGKSQAELAAALGLNVSTWSRIENGESALTVEQLAVASDVLGIEPSNVLLTVERQVVELGKRGIETSVTRTSFDAIAAAGAIPLIGASLISMLSPIPIAAIIGAVAGYRLYSKLVKPNG